MNAYSYEPSDHPADAGMNTLMCIAVLTSGICSDESCTVYNMNMRPSQGNCLVSDSESSVRAAVLNPLVSILFLRAQGAHDCGAVGISPYHRLIMDPLQVKTERITCWGHCFWFPCLGEQVPCCIDIVGSVCTLHILQTNVSEHCMVSSVSSPMPKFFSNPRCSLKIFHDDRLA